MTSDACPVCGEPIYVIDTLPSPPHPVEGGCTGRAAAMCRAWVESVNAKERERQAAKEQRSADLLAALRAEFPGRFP